MNSVWWAPVLMPSQGYGCTDLALEGHNLAHPECLYFHEGIDVPLPCGTPIKAGRAVQVTACDPPGYGPPGDTAAICLWDRATDRDIWMYHMASYRVQVGEYVKADELIGYSGTRGYSTGCHIHFEVRGHGLPYRVWYPTPLGRPVGSSIDPTPFITGDVMTPQEAAQAKDTNDKITEVWNLLRTGKHADANPRWVFDELEAIKNKPSPIPPAPVIDNAAIAAAVVAILPPQSKPPVASQAVKDWLQAVLKHFGWA